MMVQIGRNYNIELWQHSISQTVQATVIITPLMESHGHGMEIVGEEVQQ